MEAIYKRDPVQTGGNPDIIYGVEERPPFKESILFALQHIFAMFAGNVTVPILVVSTAGLSGGEGTFLIQCALLMAGVVTLLQVMGPKGLGSRLPIMMGTSNAFITTILSIVSQFGIPACLGAGFVGGLFEILLGGFIPRLKRIFNPLVTGIVVMTIGLTLIPTGIRQAAGANTAAGVGAPINLLLSGVVIFVVVLCHASGKKMLKSASILIGIVVGYLLAVTLQAVDFGAVGEAGWFSIPAPMRYPLEFRWPAIVAMLFMFLATTIETIGDTASLTTMSQGRVPTQRESRGAVLADGIGSVMAALYNAFPNTSYSQNIGVVNLTGVFSRHVVSIGAILLVAMSFLPKLASVILCVPGPVLGGATLITFVMVFLSGITLICQERLDSRNLLVMAVSLGIGVGCNLVPEVVSAAPQSLALCLTNGITPAAVLAIAMDNFLPKAKGAESSRPQGVDV
ncbi:uracil-xanthine permease family protein [Flavonifractor porci]|uniref:uracil-xanthine permease family protein n=1 Tax=Flavonifractor porci TaxID=3133422 RepID=UPI0030A81F4A